MFETLVKNPHIKYTLHVYTYCCTAPFESLQGVVDVLLFVFRSQGREIRVGKIVPPLDWYRPAISFLVSRWQILGGLLSRGITPVLSEGCLGWKDNYIW